MEYRYVEILKDGEWIRDEFENIREGDIYKLYEPDGTFLDEFTAISNPEPCEPEGNWIVRVVPKGDEDG